jgi:hypothetical protein
VRASWRHQSELQLSAKVAKSRTLQTRPSKSVRASKSVTFGLFRAYNWQQILKYHSVSAWQNAELHPPIPFGQMRIKKTQPFTYMHTANGGGCNANLFSAIF